MAVRDGRARVRTLHGEMLGALLALHCCLVQRFTVGGLPHDFNWAIGYQAIIYSWQLVSGSERCWLGSTASVKCSALLSSRDEVIMRVLKSYSSSQKLAGLNFYKLTLMLVHLLVRQFRRIYSEQNMLKHCSRNGPVIL